MNIEILCGADRGGDRKYWIYDHEQQFMLDGPIKSFEEAEERKAERESDIIAELVPWQALYSLMQLGKYYPLGPHSDVSTKQPDWGEMPCYHQWYTAH